ncbi:MAG TPA: energy transducer TonB [Pyrinomonadaceae bacterium]|jgi:protein TonB|nr:energy transducer TonB [Pyrinomonadaceae bacterium]
MFHNLIESGSHRRDLARRGRFFLGTLASYALVAACVGVAGVYAYSAHLDEQDYQITMLPAWARPAAAREIVQPDPPAGRHSAGGVSRRREFYADLRTTPPSTPPISTHYNPIPPRPPGFVLRDDVDSDAAAGVVGPTAPGGVVGAGTLAANVRPHVVETEDVRPPDPPAPTPARQRVGVLKLSNLVTSKIVSKPVPAYPQIAKAAGIQGAVSVEILVDEQGRVISAKATTGHALLRIAAQQAAMQARFTPTKLDGEPVKVSGVITYNFVLN